jgi:hypothetical protein
MELRLPVVQLLRNFPALYGIRRFIAAFTGTPKLIIMFIFLILCEAHWCV